MREAVPCAASPSPRSAQRAMSRTTRSTPLVMRASLAVVDLVRCVARLVVVRIAERRRVGQHDGRKAELAERPVVRPADARNRVGRHAADGRKGRVLAQRAHHLVQERARGRHADHGDEIADRRVDQAERRRKLLRARLVREVAHRLQRDHAAHALATLGKLLGIAPAAHVRRAEVGRLLVDEQHVADAQLLGLPVLQQPRQLQRGGDARAVVVGARRVIRRSRSGHRPPASAACGAAALRLARRLDVAHRAARRRRRPAG